MFRVDDIGSLHNTSFSSTVVWSGNKTHHFQNLTQAMCHVVDQKLLLRSENQIGLWKVLNPKRLYSSYWFNIEEFIQILFLILFPIDFLNVFLILTMPACKHLSSTAWTPELVKRSIYRCLCFGSHEISVELRGMITVNSPFQYLPWRDLSKVLQATGS